MAPSLAMDPNAASAFRRDDSRDSIIVVSGLPRSGTSMMMRMLEAGGLHLLTDGRRAADDSNPMGYYEDERVKQLRAGHDEWLHSAVGCVVKVVSPLLQHLPARHSYQLIFMVRDIAEIVDSQRRMLLRGGGDPDAAVDDDLAAAYRKHLSRVQAWLTDRPSFDTMYVRYADVVDDPIGYAVRISQFLGRAFDTAAMAAAVDPSLYRERHESI